VAGALALIAPAPAGAGLYHPKAAACSFGKDGTSGSAFAVSPRPAFQQQAKALYVAGSETSPVGIYGYEAAALCPAGASGGYPFLAAFAPRLTPALRAASRIAVDNSSAASAGNVYTLSNAGEAILGYEADGTELGAGTGAPGFPIAKPEEEAEWEAVAVDGSGNVWAIDTQERVHEYDARGAEVRTPIDLSGSALAPLGNQADLDFDAAGDLYVESNFRGVWKLAAPEYDAPAQIAPPKLGSVGITVDRASGEVYVVYEQSIERLGPGGAAIERFPSPPLSGAPHFTGVAVDEASKDVYAYEAGGVTNRVQAFEALTLPDPANGALGELGETTVRLNGTVDPAGLALAGCRFEWVGEGAFQQTGFADLSTGGEAACTPAFGTLDPNGGPQAVSAAISGLSPGGRYRFRIVASNGNGTNSSPGAAFQLAQPGAETIGSPIRSATTARLDSRVDPHGIPTEYHFEYISDAAYQANLAASQPPFAGAIETSARSAGSGGLIVLASEAISGLSPATAYHYRVLADNGAFGGPATGEERTLTTRDSDAPLSHGRFPGPPGSDRAWEQVNLPDTSGNPVNDAAGISDDGETALYRVFGGTPASETGTFYDYLFARRPAGEHPSEGWQTEAVYPSREEATFSIWRPPTGDSSLSSLLSVNLGAGIGAAVWRIPTKGGDPTKLYEAPPGVYGNFYMFSDDGSRALLLLKGEHVDSAHPSPGGKSQLYDVSSGEPRMVGLLPSNVVPACGTSIGQGLFELPINGANGGVARSTHWVSADGSRAFFANSCAAGAPHLYMRDFETETSVRADGPPLSGPDCSGAMIRSTPSALYLWTQSRLAADDTAIGSCDGNPGEFTPGGDVYRYDLASHEFSCLTCVAPGGAAANVAVTAGFEGAAHAIAVAPEGPRLYFTTRSQLLAGAAEAGTPAIYRVNTETGALAYVGPVDAGDRVGENPVGAFDKEGTAITADGRFLAFRSAAQGLDQLTGSDNGNTAQYYLYDDAERSLVCASCPAGGSPPRAAAAKGIVFGAETAPNMTPLAGNGDFAFATPTALVGADQNTAAASKDPRTGSDVYEWRDGRALLVSDGLTAWPVEGEPQVAAIGPSGRDLFFVEAAQLTPDAPDGSERLYDARIGGGISFPEVTEECDLEVCQPASQGAPADAPSGTSTFHGAGNVLEESQGSRRCAKGKHRVKGRCMARRPHRKAKATGGKRSARHGGRAGR
jgi:hypothetical protein